MRTREEIKADYFKDCGYEDGDFITTDEDYLLEEIFKVQNQAKNNEVLDLVMLTPDAIAKHLEWDSYHHMMINGEHIDHQLKEAINMLFFTNKLEIPFD